MAKNIEPLVEYCTLRTSTCLLCFKNYTSKSTQMSVCRINGKFMKYAKDMEWSGNHQNYDIDDKYSLGIHLQN